MKDFDKWWNKEIRPYIHNSKDKDIVRAGWRAALEWVQPQFDFGSNVAYSTDDILMAVKKEIREELEE